MLIAGEGLFLVELCLLVFCVLSIVSTPPELVRGLPKLVWLLLVVVLPLVGGIAWLVAGRPVGGSTSSLPYKGNAGVPPQYDRPGRATATHPDDDAAFLASLRERADAQRAEAARRRREELDREEAAREAEREAARERRRGQPPVE